MSQMVSVTGTLAAILFILYVLLGYPALLALLARYHSRPVRRRPFQCPVSVIVAVHNGSAFIEAKLRSISALKYPRNLMEVIVVSDGSSDGTDEIVQQFAREGIRLLRVPKGGKSAALMAGIAQASGEILVLTDVRQTLAPDSLTLLIENFADPEVGVASGELTIAKGSSQEESSVGLYWRYELWIRLRLSELDSLFGATGAFYAIRRHLAVPIPAGILLDDMFLPMPAFFKGYRLIVDSRARIYDFPTGLQSEFRRKVRTLAGNYQILQAFPGLLGPQNRLWVHFVSYKFARLLLPFALLALLAFSFGLARPWSTLFIAGQLAFYFLALLDRWISGGVLKTLTSPIGTFVTLMIASFLAPAAAFFISSEKLWKPTQAAGSPPPLADR